MRALVHALPRVGRKRCSLIGGNAALFALIVVLAWCFADRSWACGHSSGGHRLSARILSHMVLRGSARLKARTAQVPKRHAIALDREELGSQVNLEVPLAPHRPLPPCMAFAWLALCFLTLAGLRLPWHRARELQASTSWQSLLASSRLRLPQVAAASVVEERGFEALPLPPAVAISCGEEGVARQLGDGVLRIAIGSAELVVPDANNISPVGSGNETLLVHQVEKSGLVVPPSHSDATLPSLSIAVEPAPQSPLNAGIAGVGTEVTFLYASPLCFMSRDRGPAPMPTLQFEREWEALVFAAEEAAVSLQDGGAPAFAPRVQTGPDGSAAALSLAARPLTAASLQRAIAPALPSVDRMAVLHLSAHGADGGLVLEDGKGTAHFLNGAALSDMLDLRQELAVDSRRGGLKLVFLNACSLYSFGLLFAQSGIPHVICSSADIHDAASHLFLSIFYTHLFQGRAVAQAFKAALVALRNDPRDSTRAAATSLHLLPEGAKHDEVLFSFMLPLAASRSPAGSSTQAGSCFSSEGYATSSSDESRQAEFDFASSAEDDFVSEVPGPGPYSSSVLSRWSTSSPFGDSLPQLPEDFLGRALDVWSVLQHLSARRSVVVCGAVGTDRGIGKSVLVDAVHRAYRLQMGGLCVAAPLRRGHGSNNGLGCWLAGLRGAVRSALLEHGASFFATPAPSTDAHAEVDYLIADVRRLAGVAASLRRGWAAAGGQVLLVLDDCDELLDEPLFEVAVSRLLQGCGACRVLLCAHEGSAAMGVAGGRFKLVPHQVSGLAPRDAARLFLARARRPLRWGELPAAPWAAGAVSASAGGHAALPSEDSEALVMLSRANEAVVLQRVSALPCVVEARGHPRGLLELAGRMGVSLQTASELS